MTISGLRRAWYRPAVLVAVAIFSAMTTRAAVSQPTEYAPAYKSTAAKAVTGPVDVTLKDETRDKSLPVTIWYPSTGRNYPVIIFSHGAGGSPTGYAKLLEYWAEHGYVVIAPTHADAQHGGLFDVKSALDSTGSPEDRVNRVADVTFLVGALNSIAAKIPQLKDKMDKSDIGVGGHSYGAYVAMVVGGATVDLDGSGHAKSYRDRRVRSVLLMSPQGVGRMELTSSSWNDFTIPMLLMTGSLDRPFGNVDGTSRTDPYRLAPSGHKYQLYIDGANHLSFCDVMSNLPQRPRLFLNSRTGPLTQQEIYEFVKAGSLAFWDCTLKGSTSARQYLTSDEMASTSDGAVHPSHG